MSSLSDLARAADHKRTLAPCGDIEGAMLSLGKKARAAASLAGSLTTAQKNGALHAMAARLASSQADILAANKMDLAQMEEDGRKDAYIRRAKLDSGRIETIIADLHKIADLKDPVGEVMASWERPNGLSFERVRTPLGVIGVIFESRPNVTVDAGALCFKSGNAVILRGGSDCYATNQALLRALRAGLTDYAIDENIIQMVETRARDAVGMMLQGLNGAIDVIVPRGGKSLVARVEAEAAIPVFAHLEGICHMFIDRFADCDMARDLALNAKMRRPEICGALETLLIHRDCVDTHLTPILSALAAAGCEIRGDMSVCNIFPPAKAATQQDWQSEYLDAIIAVRVVDGLDEAIYHIQTYGSGHTDAIVTENEERAQTFLTRVDSAIVMHNTSTQFADGGEFGFGAEIGISTGRMHARGPIGLEQLTSFNYRVRGQGQTRP